MAAFFSQIIEKANMIDLALSCAGPTWRNVMVGDEGINKRMDIFLASTSLSPYTVRQMVWAHPLEVSDHYPVCLEWTSESASHIYPFKFDRSCLQEEDFTRLVRDY